MSLILPEIPVWKFTSGKCGLIRDFLSNDALWKKVVVIVKDTALVFQKLATRILIHSTLLLSE